MSKKNIEIIPVHGLPEFKIKDDLIKILTATLKSNSENLLDGDVLVVTQKIISKIEDRAVDLQITDINEVLKNGIYSNTQETWRNCNCKNKARIYLC